MPQASARCRAEAGGSTATTMRASGGALADAAALDQRARPQRVGALLDDLAVESPAGRAACRHSARPPCRETPAPDCRRWRASPRASPPVAGSAISRLISAIGRGVVVITCRGRSPRRSPNCSMSKVASAWRHLASSSAQAAANCGPRRLSGSSAENTCATAPFGHSSRRRDGIHAGRSPRAMHGEQAGDALDHHLAHVVLGLADQRDRRACPLGGGKRRDARAMPRTHSAPARVLPAPRPPSISQVVQAVCRPRAAETGDRATAGRSRARNAIQIVGIKLASSALRLRRL